MRTLTLFISSILVCITLVGISLNVSMAESAERGEIIFYTTKKPIINGRRQACALWGDRLWGNTLSTGIRGRDGKVCKNNEARWVALFGPIRRGMRIVVFDDKNGSTDKGWAEIILNQDLYENQRLIIGSFESTQYNPYFRVRNECPKGSDGIRKCPFDGGDYLDDKVSWITIQPQGAK